MNDRDKSNCPVWDEAESVLDTMLSNHGYEGWRSDSIETIARAILKAHKEAYEDAAQIVERIPSERANDADGWTLKRAAQAIRSKFKE